MSKIKFQDVPDIVHHLDQYNSVKGLTKECFVFLGIVKRIEKLESINFKDMGKSRLSGYDLMKFNCFQVNYYEWKEEFEESYSHLIKAQGVNVRNLLKRTR